MMSMIKRVSGFGLMASPITAQIGIKIDTTVVVVPFLLLKSDAKNIRKPTMGTIINEESISFSNSRWPEQGRLSPKGRC